MRQFDLDKYLKNPNRKVVTRDGKSVRIVCTDMIGAYRVVAICKMTPIYAPSECPYNCVGCEHLKGVVYYGNDDVEVECDLDEEDGQ